MVGVRRRQVLLGCSAFAVAGAFAAPAIAESPPTEIRDKSEFDVPGGYIRRFVHPPTSAAIKAGEATFRVRFTIERAHRSKEYIPLFTFAFDSQTGQKLNVDFRYLDSSPSLLIAPRLWRVVGGEPEELQGAWVTNLKKHEPHELSFATGLDTVTLAIGAARMIMRTGYKPEYLTIRASGMKGQVEFVPPIVG